MFLCCVYIISKEAVLMLQPTSSGTSLLMIFCAGKPMYLISSHITHMSKTRNTTICFLYYYIAVKYLMFYLFNDFKLIF